MPALVEVAPAGGEQGGAEDAERVVGRDDLERPLPGCAPARRRARRSSDEVAAVDAALAVAEGEVGLDALDVAVEDAGAERVVGRGADGGEGDLVVGHAGDAGELDLLVPPLLAAVALGGGVSPPSPPPSSVVPASLEELLQAPATRARISTTAAMARLDGVDTGPPGARREVGGAQNMTRVFDTDSTAPSEAVPGVTGGPARQSSTTRMAPSGQLAAPMRAASSEPAGTSRRRVAQYPSSSGS